MSTESQKPDRSAWLIERTDLPVGPVYLTVSTDEWRYEWTPDHYAALQHSSKGEAERAWAAASRDQAGGDAMSDARIRITEHLWMDGPAKEPK